MKRTLKVTVLGSGTSQGVPVIGCKCPVCTSTDPRDKRLRSSILLSWGGENFVVDTGPDFRQQMLREEIDSLRAVLFTHEHKDHIAGMDDVRSFNFLERRDMEVYCSNRVEVALKREFYYCFTDDKYPGVPNVNLNIIDKAPFRLPDGPMVTPIEYYHYKLPVNGFRLGNFAYLTDFKSIESEEYEKLKGVKYLILDCLRRKEHLSHLNLDEALAFVEQLKPEKTYFTHISHLFDTHENILKELPSHIEPAFDGLSFFVEGVE